MKNSLLLAKDVTMKCRWIYRVSILGLVAPVLFSCATPLPKEKEEEGLKAFSYVLQHIHKDYVEPIESRLLIEKAMQGMLDSSGLSLASVGLPPAALTMQSEPGAKDSEQIPFSSLRAFTELYTAIKTKDPSQDNTKLFDGAIRGMMTRLDDRSEYLDRTLFSAQRPPSDNAAIGLELAKRDGAIRVVAALEDTPAAASGLVAGDIIEVIDGRSVKNVSLAEAVTLLRGAAGSTVVLTVTTTGGERIEKRVERKVITLTRIQGRMVAKDIAYVRIKNFATGTARELSDHLVELEAKNGMLRGLVLDLRSNPGGALEEAISVADEFIAAGQIVVIKGRTREGNLRFNAAANRTYPARELFPIVVLVDGGTAAGSEIVAAALQDHRRAIVVGSNTYGLASIQTLFTLPNGGALKLTTGQYLRSDNSFIFQVGVIPDICVREGKAVFSQSEHSVQAEPCPKSVTPHQPGERDKALEFAVEYLSRKR